MVIDVKTLPCGCVLTRQIVDGVKELQIAPCKKSCVNLKNAMELAEEKNLPIERRIK